jgi:hypothetical protein
MPIKSELDLKLAYKLFAVLLDLSSEIKVFGRGDWRPFFRLM